jgi:hypothetical protein
MFSLLKVVGTQKIPVTRVLGGFLKLLLAIGILLAVADPVRGESQRTLVNLRGDQVVVPADVPPKERFLFRRIITLDDRAVVFLYSDPRFRRPVDYAETYNLVGELLEVAWYVPAEGVRRARDVNLGKRDATGAARVLEMLDESLAEGR